MFKRHLLLKLVIIALIIAAGVYVVAYATAGDSSDPLISLSYIENIFKPQVMDKVESLVDTAKDDLQGSIDSTLSQFKSSLGNSTVANAMSTLTGNGYESVILEDGCSIHLGAGCEVLAVSGQGTISGSITDTTAGSALDGGSISENHLYLCTEAADILASGQVQLLVKGDYELD